MYVCIYIYIYIYIRTNSKGVGVKGLFKCCMQSVVTHLFILRIEFGCCVVLLLFVQTCIQHIRLGLLEEREIGVRLLGGKGNNTINMVQLLRLPLCHLRSDLQRPLFFPCFPPHYLKSMVNLIILRRTQVL